MVYRLYYWYNGAPEDRPGGPWWYKDFKTRYERSEFLTCGHIFFKKYCRFNFENTLKNRNYYNHHPLKIAPPKECQIIN